SSDDCLVCVFSGFGADGSFGDSHLLFDRDTQSEIESLPSGRNVNFFTLRRSKAGCVCLQRILAGSDAGAEFVSNQASQCSTCLLSGGDCSSQYDEQTKTANLAGEIS